MIDGASARRVLIRAVGPALAQLGVDGAITEPRIDLFDSRGQRQGTASAWGLQANADEIRAAFGTTGAFAFAEGSKDAALLATLRPGGWTVQISDGNNRTGVALVEVYDVP